MRKVTPWIFALLALCSAVINTSFAEEQELDRVAVIVNEGVVLESEVQELISSVRRNIEEQGGAAPSDSALRTQAMERLILQSIQMQMAERMGLRVSDAQLDQVISSIASENNIPIDMMREQVVAEGQDWEQYRESIRREIAVNEVQRSSVQRRVYISPQEVNNLVNILKEREAEDTEYRVSQILISLLNEEGEEDQAAALSRAGRIVELLDEGQDFAQLAITASSAANALEGGDMGWQSLNQLPTLFAEAIENAETGDVVGPLRSGVGYFILKVEDTRGAELVTSEEVRARHILIRPSVILSDDRARTMLTQFRERIQSGEAEFADLAREHSADPGSAANGGNLGWADPEMYVPEFRQRVVNMDLNVLSEPFRTEHGWHIVEVLERRVQDVTDERMQNQARQLLFTRKYNEEMDIWLQEIRDDAYIEIK